MPPRKREVKHELQIMESVKFLTALRGHMERTFGRHLHSVFLEDSGNDEKSVIRFAQLFPTLNKLTVAGMLYLDLFIEEESKLPAYRIFDSLEVKQSKLLDTTKPVKDYESLFASILYLSEEQQGQILIKHDLNYLVN